MSCCKRSRLGEDATITKRGTNKTTRGHDAQGTRVGVNEISTLQDITNEARDRTVNERIE